MRNVLVHYDVTQEYISVDTFLTTAFAARSAAGALNRLFFGGTLDLEVVIFPPKSGTFKQYIGIICSGVTAVSAATFVTLTLSDSETVQEISIAITGKKPSEHIIDIILSRANPEAKALKADEAENVCDFLAESVIGVLNAEPNSIEKIAIPDQIRYDLQKTQSDFFEAALADNNIIAVGFSEEDDFPIPRNQFAVRAVPPRLPREEPDLAPAWVVGHLSIQVTSPNFDRSEQSSRKWKGKTTTGRSILFEVHDEEFWQKISSRRVKFREGTELRVQVASNILGSRVRERRVLRVLTVDGVPHAEPLDDNAISAILGDFREGKVDIDQLDLFDS